MRAALAIATVAAILLVAAPASAVTCTGPDDMSCSGIGGCYDGTCVDDGTGAFVCATLAAGKVCTPVLSATSPDEAPVNACHINKCSLEPEPACLSVKRQACILCKSDAICERRPRLCRTSRCSARRAGVTGRCVYSRPQAGCCNPKRCKGTPCAPKQCVYPTLPVPGDNFPQGTCELIDPPPASPCCASDADCPDDFDICTEPGCSFEPGSLAGTCAVRPTYNSFEETCCNALYDCIPPVATPANFQQNCFKRNCNRPDPTKGGLCEYTTELVVRDCQACIPGSTTPGQFCTKRGPCRKPACKGPRDPRRPYTCTTVPDPTKEGLNDGCRAGQVCNANGRCIEPVAPV